MMIKRKLLSAAAALALSAGSSYALYTLSVDKVQNSAASVPVMSACGGTVAGDAGSSDFSGTVTQGGTVTTCTITFGTAFVAKPACIVTDLTATRAGMTSVASNTAITVTAITAGDALAWACFAKAGG